MARQGRVIVGQRLAPGNNAGVDFAAIGNLSGNGRPQLPKTGIGFVYLASRITRQSVAPTFFQFQAMLFGIAQHPGQRDVGQVAFLVGAAHIRMHAGKPNLLYRLSGGKIGFILKADGEFFTFFVDSHRVISIRHIGVQAVVKKLFAVHHP